MDFVFSGNATDGYSILGAANSSVGFAALYGAYDDTGALTLGLSADNGLEPMYDITSIMGQSLRSLIQAI